MGWRCAKNRMECMCERFDMEFAYPQGERRTPPWGVGWDLGIYSSFRRRFYAVQTMRCNLCGAAYAVQPMRCNLRGAINLGRLEDVLSNARANIQPSQPQLV